MNQNEIDNELRTRLDEIKSVPPRGQKQSMLGRAKFLNEAMRIEETVSARKFLRHIRWIPIGKEKLVMNAVISLIVMASVLFAGGVTVNAAQDDLPGQPLYAIKTASEDFNLQFQNDPEAKVTRLMDMAQLRIQEMSKLIDEGKTPPDQVRDRLEQHIRQALKVCTTMDDATLDRTLLQLRDQLRQQDRDMEKLQLNATPDAQLLLERTRTMLQLRLQVVDDGLLNHEQFRNTVRNGLDAGQNNAPVAPAGTQNQNQNQQQNGPSTTAPGGPNLEPGGPNTNPGGPNDNGTGTGDGICDGTGDSNGDGICDGTGTGTGNGTGDGICDGCDGTGTGTGNGTGDGICDGTCDGTSGTGSGGTNTGGNKP